MRCGHVNNRSIADGSKRPVEVFSNLRLKSFAVGLIVGVAAYSLLRGGDSHCLLSHRWGTDLPVTGRHLAALRAWCSHGHGVLLLTGTSRLFG